MSLKTFMKMILVSLICFFSFISFVNAENLEKPHHISLFIGGTHMLDDDHNGETFGLDYEYCVSEILGLGVVLEHAFDDIDATTFLTVADIHTPIGMIFQVGPGIEFTDHGDRFLFRVGTMYEFKFDHHYTLSPQLHFDIAENAHDSIVFGFAIGKSF